MENTTELHSQSSDTAQTQLSWCARESADKLGDTDCAHNKQESKSKSKTIPPTRKHSHFTNLLNKPNLHNNYSTMSNKTVSAMKDMNNVLEGEGFFRQRFNLITSAGTIFRKVEELERKTERVAQVITLSLWCNSENDKACSSRSVPRLARKLPLCVHSQGR